MPAPPHALALALAVACCGPNLAAQHFDRMFLRVPGVPGSCLHAQFRGWHDVEGFGLMLSRPLGFVSAPPGPLTMSAVTVWMPLVLEAPDLTREALLGDVLGTMELVAVRGPSAAPVLHLVLDARLRAVRWDGDAARGLTLELGFDRVAWISYDGAGTATRMEAAVPAGGVQGVHEPPGFDPLPELGGTLYSGWGSLRVEDYAVRWALEPAGGTITPLRLLSFDTAAMAWACGNTAIPTSSLAADLLVDWPGLLPFLRLRLGDARLERVAIEAADGAFAMELDLSYDRIEWTFVNLYTGMPRTRRVDVPTARFVPPPPREPDPPTPWVLFAELPGYPGPVLTAGYQSWHHAFGFASRAGHTLEGSAEAAALSALPWDTLPDLMGLHAGHQVPALPVVRLHGRLPSLTMPYFELELHEPALVWTEVDGSNVHVRYGVLPRRRIVWTTRDPLGGPVRTLCWDLLLQRPCP